MAPEHDARTRAFYDHESDEPRRRRRRAAADWGVNEDIFDRMPSRRFRRPRAEHHDDARRHRFERRDRPVRRPPTASRVERETRSTAWTREPERAVDAASPRRETTTAEPRRAPETRRSATRDERRAGERVTRPRRERELAASARDGELAAARRAAPRATMPLGADGSPTWPAPMTTCRSRTASARSTRGWRRRRSGARARARGEPDGRARARPSRLRAAARRSRRQRRTVKISGHPDRLPVPRAQRPPKTAVERIGAQPGPDRGLRGRARVPARADRRSHHRSIIDVRSLAGHRVARHILISRKSAPQLPHGGGNAQDRDESVPHPRRPDGAGGIAADPQGCVVSSRAASELPRRAGGRAGGAEGVHALSEPSSGTAHLPRHSAERIGLAVAEHYGSKPGLQLHTRTSRQAGLGIDEVARAKRWDSGDAARGRAAAVSAPAARRRAKFPQHLHEEAREAGWSGRTASGSDRGAVHGILHRDGQRRRRRPGGRVGRGDAGVARGVIALRAMGVTAQTPTRHSTGVQPVLPALPRGGGAGRQALDRRDPLRPAARRSDALHGDRQRGAGSVATACCRERMKELEAARDRRAPRERRHADQGLVRADDEGPSSSRPRWPSSRRWADRWLD